MVDRVLQVFGGGLPAEKPPKKPKVREQKPLEKKEHDFDQLIEDLKIFDQIEDFADYYDPKKMPEKFTVKSKADNEVEYDRLEKEIERVINALAYSREAFLDDRNKEKLFETIRHSIDFSSTEAITFFRKYIDRIDMTEQAREQLKDIEARYYDHIYRENRLNISNRNGRILAANQIKRIFEYLNNDTYYLPKDRAIEIRNGLGERTYYNIEKTKVLKYFFEQTIPFLKKDEKIADFLQSGALIKGKSGIKRQIMQKVDQTPRAEKLKKMKKMIDIVGADYVLNHFDEFNLEDKQAEKLMLEIAQKDPLVMVMQSQSIEFKDFSNRKEILGKLFEKLPRETLVYSEELGLKQNDRIEFLEKVSKKDPFDFIAAYEQASAGIVISKKQRQEFEENLLTAIEKQKLSDAELLNNISGLDFSQFPELEEIIKLVKKQAIKNFVQKIDQLITSIKNDESKLKKYKEKYGWTWQKQEAEKYFADKGLESFHADIKFLAARLNFDLEFPSDDADFEPDDDVQMLFLEEQLEKRKADSEDVVVHFDLRPKPKTEDEINTVLEYIDISIEKYGPDDLDLDNLNTILYFFKDLPISKGKKNEYLKRLIDTDIRIFTNYNIKEIKLDDNLKIYLCDKILEQDPYILARNYNSFQIKDKRKEQLYFRDLIKRGIKPFSWLKNEKSLLQVIKGHSLPYYAFDIDYTEEEQQEIMKKIHRARLKMGSKAWNAMIDYAGESRVVQFESMFEKMPEEKWALFGKLLGSDPKKALEYIKSNIDYLQLLIYIKEKDLPKAKELWEELDQLIKKQKNKSSGRHWYNYEYTRKKFPYTQLDQQEKIFLIVFALQNKQTITEAFDQLKKINQSIEEKTEKSERVFAYLSEVDDIQMGYNRINKLKKQIVDFINKNEKYDGFLKYAFAHMNEKQIRAYLGLDLTELAKGYNFSRINKFFETLIKDNKIDIVKKEEVKLFRDYIKQFGRYDSAVIFENYKLLLNQKPLTAELKKLGVTNTGKQGLKEFEKKMDEIISAFSLNGEFDYERIDISNPLVVEILKNASNFEFSEWQRSKDFKEILEGIKRDKEAGEIKPMPKEYESDFMFVERLKRQEEFEFSPDSEQRFKKLIDDIKKAEDYGNFYAEDYILQERDRLEEKFRQMHEKKMPEDKREKIVQKLRYDLVRIEGLLVEVKKIIYGDFVLYSEEQTRKHLLDLLIDFEIRNKVKKENNFTSPAIRQLVIYEGMQTNPVFFEAIQDILNNPELSRDNYSKMIEFVNHIIKEETCSRLALNKKQLKRVIRNLSVRALSEEMARLQKHESGNKVEIEIVPSRDVLAELSGYYGDACWTSRDDIMKNNPNMIGCAFVINPRGKDQRLAGSCLIIESTVEGEPVMIMRGINPQQNVITNLSAEKFTEKFLDYMEKIAKKRGIKKILVPVHDSGALTNRPDLEDYLQNKYSEAKKVKLDEKNEFNEYNITEKCVVVREVKSAK